MTSNDIMLGLGLPLKFGSKQTESPNVSHGSTRLLARLQMALVLQLDSCISDTNRKRLRHTVYITRSTLSDFELMRYKPRYSSLQHESASPFQPRSSAFTAQSNRNIGESSPAIHRRVERLSGGAEDTFPSRLSSSLRVSFVFQMWYNFWNMSYKELIRRTGITPCAESLQELYQFSWHCFCSRMEHEDVGAATWSLRSDIVRDICAQFSKLQEDTHLNTVSNSKLDELDTLFTKMSIGPVLGDITNRADRNISQRAPAKSFAKPPPPSKPSARIEHCTVATMPIFQLLTKLCLSYREADSAAFCEMRLCYLHADITDSASAIYSERLNMTRTSIMPCGGDGPCLEADPGRCASSAPRHAPQSRVTPGRVYPASAGLPQCHSKYWAQRYRLFSRYDEGILLDTHSWCTVTPEAIASHIAWRLRHCHLVIDAFCGCGGNTIQLARVCPHVVAVDNNAERVRMARHNAAIYGVQHRVEFIVADFFAIAPQLASMRADAIFLSAPWGGPSYCEAPVYDMRRMDGVIDGRGLLRTVMQVSPNVAMLVPRNANILQIVSFPARSSSIEIEQNLLSGRLKTITVYVGNVANNFNN